MVIISLALSASKLYKIMDRSWSYLGMLAVALGWRCALSMVFRLRWETRRDDAPNLPNEVNGWTARGAPLTRGCPPQGMAQRRRVRERRP